MNYIQSIVDFKETVFIIFKIIDIYTATEGANQKKCFIIHTDVM